MNFQGFLLLALIASTFAWPLFIRGNLEQPGVYITAAPFRANLETDARIELTHSLPLQICFQVEYPLPQNPDTWNQTCTDYFSFDADGTRIIHTGSVRLRDVTYNVGIYSANGFEPQTDVRLKIGNVNDSCANGQIFDETADICRNPDGELVADTPASGVVFAPGATLYYSFSVDDLVGSVSVKGMGTQPGNLIFQIRYAGSPSYGVHDGSSGSTAVVNFPKPGKYYVAITSSEMAGTTGSFLLHMERCPNTNQTAGPGCRHPYAIASLPSYTSVATVGRYQYWRVVVTDKSSLWVSVRSSDGIDNPYLFATKGQLPRLPSPTGDADNIDFRLCNQPHCDGANVIRHNSAPGIPETWYIAVLPAPGANGTEYTIWFSSSCAPLCSDHGKCTEVGPGTGTCVCVDGFGGVACSQSFKVTPENIVLYIIACLVLLSGIAAFIAAMVTKKPKRPREN